MKKNTVSVTTTANIALIKYWGKRDERLMLPAKSSLSVGLSALTTTTEFETAEHDKIVTTEHHQSNFEKKIMNFVNELRRDYGITQPIKITTHNHFPTAAGLASSASGFAALTLGLNKLFDLKLGKQELSQRARLGSGSAARSVLGGFVVWHKGTLANGNNCFAEQLYDANHWPTLRILVVVVDASIKKMSSRDGMRLTVTTSPSFNTWCTESEKRISAMHQAIAKRDLEQVGMLAEADWHGMYKSMRDTQPPLEYLSGASWVVIKTVQRLRAAGILCYFTTDAGPNVKILCEERDAAIIEQTLMALNEVNNIIRNRIACEPIIT
ncbi:diphosphomevalonate decarboxylase [bacterium]|nr:MAG: diphosphomevalonate decarboxylase [bacterium]